MLTFIKKIAKPLKTQKVHNTEQFSIQVRALEQF